jgi:aspartate dehydrogenase
MPDPKDARVGGAPHGTQSARVGIVGCGTLGQAILRAHADGTLKARIVAVTSRSADKARAFLARLPGAPPYLERAALIAACDLIVEAAGAPALPDLARECFAAGKDLIVISSGALLDRPELFEQARERGCRLIVPSGAIAGIDGIKAACRGRIDRLTLTTRKPPGGLQGAPYLRERGIRLDGLAAEQEVFFGPVREAVRGFPENVNVAATVSLAGLGPDKTFIRIVAVPGLQRNCHTLEVEGEFGSLKVEIQNVPTENPKTGKLTALSMLRAIEDAVDPVRIGG